MDAITINCGHTFCQHCIQEWRKQKSQCAVCRTHIQHMLEVKVVDKVVDKMYDQFNCEDRRKARTSLQEEQVKLREACV